MNDRNSNDRVLVLDPTANAHSWGSCVDLRVVARRSITWAVALTPPAHAGRNSCPKPGDVWQPSGSPLNPSVPISSH